MMLANVFGVIVMFLFIGAPLISAIYLAVTKKPGY
jgi:hypothetical protein